MAGPLYGPQQSKDTQKSGLRGVPVVLGASSEAGRSPQPTSTESSRGLRLTFLNGVRLATTATG
jgi:hypothetical protein